MVPDRNENAEGGPEGAAVVDVAKEVKQRRLPARLQRLLQRLRRAEGMAAQSKRKGGEKWGGGVRGRMEAEGMPAQSERKNGSERFMESGQRQLPTWSKRALQASPPPLMRRRSPRTTERAATNQQATTHSISETGPGGPHRKQAHLPAFASQHRGAR